MIHYLALLFVALFGVAIAGKSCPIRPVLRSLGYKNYLFPSGPYGCTVPDGHEFTATCGNGEQHQLVCSNGMFTRAYRQHSRGTLGCD